MTSVLAVLERDAHEIRETPSGSVGVLHAGADLQAWWIWKEREDLDPDWTVLSREDFLYVVRGTLRLELRGAPAVDVGPGQCVVIPAETPFRGYRWPRDANEPCVFLAVSTAGVETTKISVDDESR